MKKIKEKKSFVVWLTGLPCSGKTSVSKELEKFFEKNKLPVIRLDGDVFREKHTKKLGFSKKDRDRNIKIAALEAKKLAESGVNVIAAFVSPYRKMRNYARKICPNFIEIYLECDLEKCIERDSRGLYKKALAGEIRNFTGIQDPYEKPTNPDLLLKTDKYPLSENMKKVKIFLDSIINFS